MLTEAGNGLIEAPIFGLLAALFWGTTDFVSRYPSRKIGPEYSTAYMQLLSMVGFTIYFLVTGFPSPEFLSKGGDLLLVVLVAGVLNVFGLMQLYRAFSVGNMSLSAPIGSSYPIFTILLGFIILRQGIGLEKGIAITIVILGVMLTGITSDYQSVDNSPPRRRRNVSAVVSAITASVFFGAAYLGIDAASDYFGSILTIWFVRIGAVLFAFPLLLLVTKKLVWPKGETWKWLILMGVLDTAGFVALTLGYIYSGNSPAIVTTLSSLLGAVTTILATAVYKDRLTKIQIAGIAILFLGVIIVLNV
ncbi:MAG TPA: DMT family transporter [Nitrososphaerales archaeon]|nr:DMT family transporter [Nitrososphaerales archaeon]